VAYDEALAARIRTLLAEEPGLTEKRMFGGLAFLLGGHMAVAASGRGGLMVRVDPDRTPELVTRPGVERMVMQGREMDGWLRVFGHPEIDDLPDTDLAAWVTEGVDFVKTLPPK
jgi:hypothetical protein